MTDNRKDNKYTPWKDLPSFCDASGSVNASLFAARRLPEIKQIWSQTVQERHSIPVLSTDALKSGGKKTSSRHLRKRATSHISYKRHRFPTAQQQSTATSRRSRRRRAQNSSSRLGPWVDQSTGDSSPCLLDTHVWHAKRFHLVNIQNWKVPAIHTNRGALAALRLAQEKCLIQDATWCQQPISFAAIRSIPLNQLIPHFAWPDNLNETVFGEGMLHQKDAFPVGAIAPVSWMICPKGLFSSRGDPSIHIFAHPTVHDAITGQLRMILPKMEEPIRFVKGGVACLRVRGTQTENCLQRALQSIKELADYFESRPGHGSILSLENIYLIRQAPRDASLKSNAGVSGYDLYCPAKKCKDLFLTMILKGEACPIGLVEEAHVCLEAEPPVPIFPRDFPDTHQGSLYWSTSDTSWSTVRRYWEGGMGRVKTSGAPFSQVNWSSIAMLPDKLKSDMPAVVVRGDFGRPFREALDASTSYIRTEKVEAPYRRRRRPPSASTVRAPAIEADATEGFRASCSALLESLSLPAILQCHVQVPNKGVLETGDSIMSMNQSNSVLGRVCTGAFSPSRGSSHGFGFIGAALFLQDVLEADRTTFLVRKEDGTREIQWGVTIRRADREFLATIRFVL